MVNLQFGSREISPETFRPGVAKSQELEHTGVMRETGREEDRMNLPEIDVVTGEQIAWDRDETDSCERGTPGCCIRHTRDSECQTW